MWKGVNSNAKLTQWIPVSEPPEKKGRYICKCADNRGAVTVEISECYEGLSDEIRCCIIKKFQPYVTHYQLYLYNELNPK